MGQLGMCRTKFQQKSAFVLGDDNTFNYGNTSLDSTQRNNSNELSILESYDFSVVDSYDMNIVQSSISDIDILIKAKLHFKQIVL